MYVDDHHRSRDLVLILIARNGLVADGARLSSARTPEDAAIDQWPERSVKESLADGGEKIHVQLPRSSREWSRPDSRAVTRWNLV